MLNSTLSFVCQRGAYEKKIYMYIYICYICIYTVHIYMHLLMFPERNKGRINQNNKNHYLSRERSRGY